MKVNEIFYSLQGEGYWTGTPAVFVRLSGCNLGCDFCDTKHQDGIEMTENEIVEEVCKYPSDHIVITGGEPLLQLTSSLIYKLHKKEKFVQIETNGSRPLTETLLTDIDWVTCSPKYGNIPNIQRINELKVVYDLHTISDIEKMESIEVPTGEYYLQPCDRDNPNLNEIITASCIKYILDNPKWKLSLQTHKMLHLQ